MTKFGEGLGLCLFTRHSIEYKVVGFRKETTAFGKAIYITFSYF